MSTLPWDDGPPGPADAELISAVRSGDVESYGELFSRHVDSARRLARQLTSPADADDLVSDAFTKVLAVLQRGGGPDLAFRAYLLTAVRRLHVDRIRSGSKLRPVDDLEPFDPGLPFRDTAVEGFENAAAARAFSSLPERWQMVLWHTEVERQKPADIAPLLGMTPNSVSALAYRAREGLRQAFLNEHVADKDDLDCRWTREHLGPYIRGGLARREAARVDEHVAECVACAAVFLELTEVNSGLAGLLAPLLLGAAGLEYLSSGSGSGLATAASAAKTWVLAHATVSAVGGVALTATACVAVYASAHHTPRTVSEGSPPVLAHVATSHTSHPSGRTHHRAHRAHDGRAVARHDRRAPGSDPSSTTYVVPPTTTSTSSAVPSNEPSSPATTGPTDQPSTGPTDGPTSGPTTGPTDGPTTGPSNGPTDGPTNGPTIDWPTAWPTALPTTVWTTAPTDTPSPTDPTSPVDQPSSPPTTVAPTTAPTTAPTSDPTTAPTSIPTSEPTSEPTSTPPVTSADLAVTAAQTGTSGGLVSVTATVTGLPTGSTATLTVSAETNAALQALDSRCDKLAPAVYSCRVDQVATDTFDFAVNVPKEGRAMTFVVAADPPLTDPATDNNTFGLQLDG